MNTQRVEDSMEMVRERASRVKYALIGNSMVYGGLLSGISLAVKEPTDYISLIAIGVFCGLGKLVTAMPEIYPYRNINLIRESNPKEIQVQTGGRR